MNDRTGACKPGYTVTEEGDLLLFGAHPDYPSPEAVPWFSERARIVRVIAEEGARIGANACAALPALRIADLMLACEVGACAFLRCPRLTHIVLSPRALRVASSAFLDCPSLLFVDFSGTEAELAALVGGALSLELLTVRTLPVGQGDTVTSGEVGGGFYCLTADGTLTLCGVSLPDYRHPQDTPWFAHRAAVRSVVADDATRRIGARAFQLMPALSRVTVGGRCEIATFAFSSCPALRELTVFSSVHTVGAYAFAGAGLTVAVMPPALRHIPMGMYDSCNTLTHLVLPVLPLLSFAPFTEGCSALSLVRFLGEEAEYRSLRRAVGLSHAGRAAFSVPKTEGAVRALEAADRAAAQVAERRAALLGVLREIHTDIATAALRLEEEECAYHTVGTRRHGFSDAFDDEGETNVRRRRRAERQWQQEERARADAEVRKERAAAKATADALSVLSSHLADAVRLSLLLDRAVGAAQRNRRTAEEEAKAIFPFSPSVQRRLTLLCSDADLATYASETARLRAAHDRSEAYRALQGFHRFSSVRSGLSELSALLGDEEQGDKDAARAVRPPRILVAGGDPLEDAATAACLRALRLAGASAVAASSAESHRADLGFDALVLCDGAAVDPHRYGERRRSLWDKGEPVVTDEARDARDYALLRAFYTYGKPILGIGRGCQLLNVSLGGSLTRTFPPKKAALHGGEGLSVHEIEVLPSSFLFSLYEPTVRPMRVASRHNTAIRETGAELAVLAKAKDGTPEVIGHTRLPVLGVQFLPEEMLLPHGERAALPMSAPDDGGILFSWFVRLAVTIREKPLTRYAAPRFSED